MSALTTLQATDLITNSRADINNNFQALNNDKVETSVLDTDTTLAANSDSKVATQKAVKAYVDAGGNVNASTTTKGIVEEATGAETSAGTGAGATGARLFVSPASLAASGLLKFGGTGADGALSISSGTTTLDAAGAQVLVKNYTSISITGTASLTISNPHASGTILILKSQGAVTVTSSGGINLSSMGSTGGTTSGANATEPTSFYLPETAGGQGGKVASGGTSTGGVMTNSRKLLTIDSLRLNSKAIQLAVGAGGGAGRDNTGGNAGGAGGRGGGSLYIECVGAFNFTTGTINLSGANGSNGAISGTNDGAGGGGGGGGGMVVCLYGSLIANTGTINANGGSGGSSTGNGTANAPGGGGAGGASPNGDGGAGGATIDGGAYDGGVAGTTGGGGGGSGGRVGAGTQTGAAGGSYSTGVFAVNTFF